MEAREAIAKAKTYFGDLFREEQISDVALEEIGFDREAGVWSVTLGFQRYRRPRTTLETASDALIPLRHEMKVVRVRDSDGGLIGISNRERGVAA